MVIDIINVTAVVNLVKNVKGAVPLWSIGRVLISLSVAVKPVGG